MRDIDWGLFGKRSFAFVIDFLLFVSVLTLMIRVFNVFMPGNDVREDAMQLYTAKEFYVFFWTVICTMVLLSTYMFSSYLSKRGQTIGHRVAKVQARALSGGPLRWTGVVRVAFVSLIRLGVIVTPGPLFAVWGGSVIGSVYLLIWGLVVALPIPVRKGNPPLMLWEALGGYRFHHYNPPVA